MRLVLSFHHLPLVAVTWCGIMLEILSTSIYIVLSLTHTFYTPRRGFALELPDRANSSYTMDCRYATNGLVVFLFV